MKTVEDSGIRALQEGSRYCTNGSELHVPAHCHAVAIDNDRAFPRARHALVSRYAICDNLARMLDGGAHMPVHIHVL